jgi:putative ABC transport system ATP-binding protein
MVLHTKTNGTAISLSNIKFSWGPAKSDFQLKINNFQLLRQESAILVGPSGAGKSTLLSLICGTIQPKEGSVKILDQTTENKSAAEKDSFRADHLGIIFQQFNLIPYLSAIDNVLLPLHFSYNRKKRSGKTQSKLVQEAERLLRALGIAPETLGKQKANTLSIGQQQRVAAARAFIGSPELIIADEPTSSLDEKSQDEFLDQLFSQKEITGATLLMVSHNARVAERFNRLIKLQDICLTSFSEEKML